MSKLRTVIYWIGFGLLWVLLSVAGLLVDRVLYRGTFLAPGIVTLIKSWIGTEGWALRVSVILSSGILGLIYGLLLGLFQWIAIRRLIKSAYGWILATSLGVSLGLMTFWSLMILLVPGRLPAGSDVDRAFGLGLLESLITGITLGFAQYLVLRRRERNVQWWVPAMIAAMMITLVVRWFVNPGASFFVFGTIGGVVIVILGALSAGSLEVYSAGIQLMDSPIPDIAERNVFINGMKRLD